MTASTPPIPAGLPERYSRRQDRYKERGGLIDVAEDASAFTDEGRFEDPARLAFFCLMFDQIHKEGVVGDVVELGVYKGKTAAILARNARRLGRTAWLMDTFTGFDAKDFAGIDAARGAQFEDTSLAAVRARVGDENTTFVQGFFPDTASQLPADGRYCLVHIDCDLYAPILSGLQYFYPRVVPGGFIIVHDYSSLSWDGAEKAVDVFFADKPESLVPMPDMAGSAVIRKQRGPDQSATWLQAKQRLAVGPWHSTDAGRLAHLLDVGWSAPEKWGVWGVGPSHTISVLPAEPQDADFYVDFDVNAFIVPGRPTLDVDVLIGGNPVTVWHFTEARNRDVRSVMVRRPATLPPQAPTVIELRPRSVLSPREIDPEQKGTRPLGVALHRVRLRQADPGGPVRAG
jgi:hypothetical protein